MAKRKDSGRDGGASVVVDGKRRGGERMRKRGVVARVFIPFEGRTLHHCSVSSPAFVRTPTCIVDP